MKKRYVQKMTTILLTAAMLCSSVPVTAETVSENETVVETEAVDNTQNDSAENEQTGEDINKEGTYVGEYGDSDIEENRADMDADYEQEDTKVEDGTEGDLSYSIYQKSDGTKYVVITDCDESAEGAIEIPAEMKGIVVTGIGNSAFESCRWLTSIEIPSSVTSIGNSAFCNCNWLTSIEIPEGVTSIGRSAFSDCNGLTSIEIPANVTSIGYSVFNYCSELTSITVVEDNKVYDSRDNCNAIIEKKTNTLISGCESTKIPTSVTSIGDYAFSGGELTSIEIPEGVMSIGNSAFYNCSGLTSIEIPASVTSIGNSVFSGCCELTSITVVEGNKAYDSRDNCNAIIEKETNTLISGCKSTKIPTSVMSIGEYAFLNCSELTSIEIPEGVTSIGNSAFYNCSELTSIEIPSSIKSIGDSAFLNCSELTSIEIPEGITSIGDSVFWNCNGLTSIEIPEGVTIIGGTAFSGCRGLTSIKIPTSVTSIGNSAFLGCNGLKDVYYTGTQEQWKAISFGNDEDDASDVFYY